MAKRKETEFDHLDKLGASKLARLITEQGKGLRRDMGGMEERLMAVIKGEGEDVRKEMAAGFAAAASDTKELRQEVIDQFDHVDTQFKEIKTNIRDIYAEVANIHRQLDRLEEQGASSAGFAKEIDIILSRVVFIEKRLGIKRVASK